jgi:RNase H
MTSRELTNSPDAFLWLHLRSWLQSRQAPVSVEWVRGHSGVAGNERADHLATSAHNDSSVIQWTTRMPPPDGMFFWPMYEGRVIPRRPRRLLREQDEAITSNRLIEQVNAVPHRPGQSPNEVKHILHMLRWTVHTNGVLEKKKCWNITSHHDSTIRAFAFKQLMGFLPTLARQHAWYPWVYNHPGLTQCAKCNHPEETQEHLYECADHMAVEEWFIARFSRLESREDIQTTMRTLRPWESLGWLQGRVHPEWEHRISMLHQDRGTSSVIRHLLRASLETWYHAIWLPRCQRTIAQEKSQGLPQGAKRRRMRAAHRPRTDAPASPTPNLPRSFIDSSKDRTDEYGRFMLQWMQGAL